MLILCPHPPTNHRNVLEISTFHQLSELLQWVCNKSIPKSIKPYVNQWVPFFKKFENVTGKSIPDVNIGKVLINLELGIIWA